MDNMNDKEYTIKEILSTYPSKYPDSKKFVFTLENVDGEISTFSKYPMEAGQIVYGHIEKKGSYSNFKWGKRETAKPAGSDEINAIKTTLAHHKFLLDSLMEKLETNEQDLIRGYEYPKEDSEAKKDTPF